MKIICQAIFPSLLIVLCVSKSPALANEYSNKKQESSSNTEKKHNKGSANSSNNSAAVYKRQLTCDSNTSKRQKKVGKANRKKTSKNGTKEYKNDRLPKEPVFWEFDENNNKIDPNK